MCKPFWDAASMVQFKHSKSIFLISSLFLGGGGLTSCDDGLKIEYVKGSASAVNQPSLDAIQALSEAFDEQIKTNGTVKGSFTFSHPEGSNFAFKLCSSPTCETETCGEKVSASKDGGFDFSNQEDGGGFFLRASPYR